MKLAFDMCALCVLTHNVVKWAGTRIIEEKIEEPNNVQFGNVVIHCAIELICKIQ